MCFRWFMSVNRVELVGCGWEGVGILDLGFLVLFTYSVVSPPIPLTKHMGFICSGR